MLIEQQAKEEFAWDAHPARERRGGAVGALVVIAAFSAVAYLTFGPAWAALSAVVLVIALNRFFFPSRFVIDEQGITAKYPLRKQRFRWSDLRRFVHDKNGGYLSTRARGSRFDAFSGMHVLFGADRQAVIERIRARISNAEGGRSCPS